MSGLQINFQKSGIFTERGDSDMIKEYDDLFYCDIGQFPIKYLGTHVSL